MKMNDIKFLPKANALSDVYSKATGMPFVGEMMAAAAGNGKSNPFKNVVLNIREKDGEGGGIYVLTFKSDIYIDSASFILYGENNFELRSGNFSPNGSLKYDTLFFDNSYENITDFPNGGTYEMENTETGETYSGKWTLNDATENCENTEFPSVEDIQIEETEGGWVGRITFDRDIRTYGDFYFEVNNETFDVANFYLESDLWDVSQFEYLGNNTFQVSNIELETPQSGEFEDFEVNMNIGKFDECQSGVEGIVGTVTTIPFTFTSIEVIKLGVDDYTVEATSNKPAPVENARVYLEDYNPDYGGNWGASITPTEEGSVNWVFNSEYEYFFNEGSITEQGECSAWGTFIEGDEHTIYCDWTYEDQTENEAL